jgi:hypothetical protein
MSTTISRTRHLRQGPVRALQSTISSTRHAQSADSALLRACAGSPTPADRPATAQTVGKRDRVRSHINHRRPTPTTTRARVRQPHKTRRAHLRPWRRWSEVRRRLLLQQGHSIWSNVRHCDDLRGSNGRQTRRDFCVAGVHGRRDVEPRRRRQPPAAPTGRTHADGGLLAIPREHVPATALPTVDGANSVLRLRTMASFDEARHCNCNRDSEHGAPPTTSHTPAMHPLWPQTPSRPRSAARQSPPSPQTCAARRQSFPRESVRYAIHPNTHAHAHAH